MNNLPIIASLTLGFIVGHFAWEFFTTKDFMEAAKISYFMIALAATIAWRIN